VRVGENDPAVAAAEALIHEARRRQRRRYALASGVVIAVVAAVTAALAGTGSSPPPAGRPPTRPHPHPVISVRQPAQIPESVNTTLVMWPVVADQAGGIYVDNLRTRHFWQPPAPAMDPGEFQPVLLVGRWIVWSDGYTHVVSAVNPGHPRLLGKAAEFAPSVTPGHVWLQYGSYLRLVAVPGGQAGPPIALPRGFHVLACTDAGLLVRDKFQRLAIWNPGAAPVALPHAAAPSPVAASARMIAYDTGCREVGIAQSQPTYGGMGYSVCKNLRVYDVKTGRLRTFARPVGTLGWVPWRANGDFWSFTDIASSGRLMAARAAVAPAGRGIARIYVLRLAPASTKSDFRKSDLGKSDLGKSDLGEVPRLVPYSAGFLISEMAWSHDSTWLFYQGPGGHLWAYQPGTGSIRSSKTPCCSYEVLAPLGGSRG
jgi:hypothetical protein